MHFGKAYKDLLESLPPELREDVIEYRQLKKLIRKVVDELTALGLSPDVLQRVLQATASGQLHGTVISTPDPPKWKGKGKESPPPAELAQFVDLERVLSQADGKLEIVQVLYEIGAKEDRIEPRLRVRVGPPTARKVDEAESIPSPDDIEISSDPPTPATTSDAPTLATSSEPVTPDTINEHSVDTLSPSLKRLEELDLSPTPSSAYAEPTWTREYLVPLAADSAFYELLSTALQALSARLQSVRMEFVASLDPLARTISHAARPMSTMDTGFTPHSHSADPANVRVGSHSLIYRGGQKSDLYAWREIFQMYMDAEIFQSSGERDRGDRSVEETEKRLNMFVERLNQANLGDGKRLMLKESKGAAQDFLQMNLFLLDIKKLQYANAEAMRKILKKHAKRTALPLPELPHGAPATDVVGAESALVLAHPLGALTLFPMTASSLTRLLVQAVGETLLPIVPAVDDYACLICTSIAFKPIRLACGHLFCVRCLVKLQKKNREMCPMCRAPTVLTADRTNVDWALLNFMKDWFPVEARAKLKQNEAEAAKEEMLELGIDTDGQGCCIA